MAGSPRPALRGTPSWMLSAWPIPDPDDWTEEDPTADADASPFYRDLGSPTPKIPDKAREARETTRYMMPMIAENTQIVPCAMRSPPLAITNGSSVLEQESEMRQAFECFQVLRGTCGYLYAFDLPQAMAANGIDIDEAQEAELTRAFGLAPRDLLTFEQFKHMAELVSSGQLGRSPPRVHDAPVPGSPDWVADKVEKPPKGKPAPKQAATRAGYSKWMLTSMGDKGIGVDVPAKVRHQIEHTPGGGVEKPHLDWSPYEQHRH